MASNVTFSSTGTTTLTSPAVTISSTASSAHSHSYGYTSSVSSLTVDGDLIVNGTNISKAIKDIQDKLLIIVPDFEQIEKYAALREAYNNYKLIEKMVQNSK